jgi:elongation factor G
MSSTPPLIEVPIEPRSETERGRLMLALAALADADSDLRVSTDAESGQIIIKGMNELHLDHALDILKRNYNLELYIGAPQVAYRETISRQVTKDYTYKKQIGGAGQFARIKIVCEPLSEGGGFTFEERAARGNVPREFIPGVEWGLESVLGSGVLAGFPVVDLKVTLVDGAYHEQDSSALTFEIAARGALKEVLREAGPVLLEPVMKVAVLTPDEHAGMIISDIKTRRGEIQEQGKHDSATRIVAIVPLACLFGYHNNLRSLSRGQATFEAEFSHYAPVPLADGDDPFRPAMGMRA